MTPPKANFFWHGPGLSCYEQACVSSFVHHGFAVRMWTYGEIHVPDGVELCDAELVYPRSQTARYTQAGAKGSLPCFTDFFRYKLLSENDGWWFDSDVLCLKDSDDFSFDSGCVFGFEDADFINGAALKIPSHLASDLLARANAIGAEQDWCFEWGQVGPKLLTSTLKSAGLAGFAQPEAVFYPIHYSDALAVLDPEQAEAVAEKCAGSLTCHLWNAMLRWHGVPKDLMPPKGSFLHRKFVEYDPSLADVAALSPTEFEHLKNSR